MTTPNTSSSSLDQRIEQAHREFGIPEEARIVIASEGAGGQIHEALNRWLASDRELSERLLRWSNTPLYNLSRPFRSLEEAANVLAGRDLSQLAVLAFVRGLFLPNLKIDVYEREALWNHSIAVGAVAAMIARTIGCHDPGLVFVAGTLHDIGLGASERLSPDSFAQVMSQIDELSHTHEVEEELLGWDHTQLGAAILAQWGMPEEVQVVARYHHSPEQAMDGPYAVSIGCVVIANYFCSRCGWASTENCNLAPPSDRVFQNLEVDQGLLTVLWKQLYPALETVSGLR
jgi:putative nucleotidyltransferase with HDIG domain